MANAVFGLLYLDRIQHQLVSLPLLNACVEASIKELAARATLTQTYGNHAKFPIEATYSFPIPNRATVCSFAMIKQDGTRVVGIAQEKQEARETYENAILQRHQASLMEQQTPDVFQVAVGNIPCEEQVTIELIIATELSEDEDDDSVRFHLPVHVGARYGRAPWSLNNPFLNPFYVSSFGVPFLRLTATVEAVARISRIGSPSHTVLTELGPDPTLPNFKELPFFNYARVSLTAESPLDKDFVLTFKSAGLDAPRCVAELHPSHNTMAMALNFVPRFSLPDIASQEFIFVVDRSGSMQGERIAAARKALVVMLRALPRRGTVFQIVFFGSVAHALWSEGSKPYNQATMEEASHHVDGMRADYGGTEIRAALYETFKQRKTDRPTSVFMLTDGDAWDLDGVLNEVKGAVESAQKNAYVRVSVLGIGNSASTAMCEGIARLGNGACMMVGEEETSFTGKVARLLKVARTPAISDISIDWGRFRTGIFEASQLEPEGDFEMVDRSDATKILNVFGETVDPTRIDFTSVPPPRPVVSPPPADVQQSPFEIRNLYPGVRLTVYAILKGKSVPETVTLRGSAAGGAEIELHIPVTLSQFIEGPISPIHALAARKIIQDLEDGQHSLQTTLGDPDDVDLLERTVRASIVHLGKTYSISSTHTSFVAVDRLTVVAPPPVPVYGAIPEALFDSIRRCCAQVRPAPPPFNPGVNAQPLSHLDHVPLSAPAYHPRSRHLDRDSTFFDDSARLVPQPSGFRGIAYSAPLLESTQNLQSRFTSSPPPAPSQRSRSIDDSRDRGRASASEDDVGVMRKANSYARRDTLAYLLDTLVRIQAFDGGFSTAVFGFVKLRPRSNLQAVYALFPVDVDDGIVATVLAMAFMATKLGGANLVREEWEGIYEKAKDYTEEALSSVGFSGLVESIEAEVVKLLA